MMMYTTQLENTLTRDVLVVGSGPSSATIAITAARKGARVTLIERYGFMGGISTQILDTFYGSYMPGKTPHKVVGGVPDLVVEALMERKKVLLRPNTDGAGQGITYDPATLKVVWEQLAVGSGVRILYQHVSG